jgi:hypothetical protein
MLRILSNKLNRGLWTVHSEAESWPVQHPSPPTRSGGEVHRPDSETPEIPCIPRAMVAILTAPASGPRPADCAKQSQLPAGPGGTGPGGRRAWGSSPDPLASNRPRAGCANKPNLRPGAGVATANQEIGGPARGRLRRTKPISESPAGTWGTGAVGFRPRPGPIAPNKPKSGATFCVKRRATGKNSRLWPYDR